VLRATLPHLLTKSPYESADLLYEAVLDDDYTTASSDSTNEPPRSRIAPENEKRDVTWMAKSRKRGNTSICGETFDVYMQSIGIASS
jgi:hypothetical protein